MPGLFLLLCGASCVSYEAAPLDLASTILDLQSLEAHVPITTDGDLTPDQLVRFALAHHPSLAVARAELGVASASTTAAGAWGDLELGWGAMDALASEWSAGHTASENYLSGLEVMIELPRPGSREAEIAGARAYEAELRAVLHQAEWELARAVRLACVDVEVAQSMGRQNERMVEITGRSNDFFTKALAVGTVTTTEASLAAADWHAARADALEQRSSLAAHKSHLNALLGLPTGFDVNLASPDKWLQTDLSVDLEALALRALQGRPEVDRARADYEQAESGLRLAIANQFPKISIGTGLSLGLGIFRDFDKREIKVATRRRDVAARQFELAVFRIRAEVQVATRTYQDSTDLHELLRSALVPATEECLTSVTLALDSGQVTPLEVLSVQGSLIDAQRRLGEARAKMQRAAILLLTVTGSVAMPQPNQQLGEN